MKMYSSIFIFIVSIFSCNHEKENISPSHDNYLKGNWAINNPEETYSLLFNYEQGIHLKDDTFCPLYYDQTTSSFDESCMHEGSWKKDNETITFHNNTKTAKATFKILKHTADSLHLKCIEGITPKPTYYMYRLE